MPAIIIFTMAVILFAPSAGLAQNSVVYGDLPGVKTLSENLARVKIIHASIVPVRVKSPSSPYLTTPGRGTSFGAATRIHLPGQEDEPTLLLTASQLLINVSSVEVQHPDLTWHTATVVSSDARFGLALLSAPLPDGPALPVNAGDAFSLSLSTPGWDTPTTPSLYSVEIGERGEEQLAFYHELKSRRPLLGAPIVDQKNRVVAIVGLFAHFKDNTWWTIDGKHLTTYLQHVVTPPDDDGNVTHAPLILRNGLQ